MPTIYSTFNTFADDATVGTAQWRAANLANAQDSDDSDADLNPVPTGTYTTHYLYASDVTETIPSGTLTEVRIIVEAAASDGTSTVNFDSVVLYNPSSETTVDQATGNLTTSDADYTFTWNTANLASCGINIATARLDEFGVKVSFQSTDNLGVSTPDVDQIRIELDYTATSPVGGGGSTVGGGLRLSNGGDSEETMRYEIISKEALPSCTASTQIFANVPAETEMVMLTIRDNGLTVQFDGTAPVAGVTGHDFAAGERVEWTLNPTSAKLVRAIDNGGAATGYISYFK